MLRQVTHHLRPPVTRVLCGQTRGAGGWWSRVPQATSVTAQHGSTPATATPPPLLCCWLRKTVLRSLPRHPHTPHWSFILSRGAAACPGTMPPSKISMPLWAFPDNAVKDCHVRLYSTKPTSTPSSSIDENHNEVKPPTSDMESGSRESGGVQQQQENSEEKLSIVQKFKLMYKQYWYVLIPVHCLTSVVWYGSFFIAAKSGVDIVPLVEWLGAGEKILSHLQNSNAGYYAIAYAMYKIATPARYTVTVGGTTLSINYLRKRGYIKPVPSTEKLKEMYEAVVIKFRAMKKLILRQRDGPSTLPLIPFRNV